MRKNIMGIFFLSLLSFFNCNGNKTISKRTLNGNQIKVEKGSGPGYYYAYLSYQLDNELVRLQVSCDDNPNGYKIFGHTKDFKSRGLAITKKEDDKYWCLENEVQGKILDFKKISEEEREVFDEVHGDIQSILGCELIDIRKIIGFVKVNPHL